MFWILLTDREEKCFYVYVFGLDNGRTRTLEEVGKVFGVTRERIRQIEAKSVKKTKTSFSFKTIKKTF